MVVVPRKVRSKDKIFTTLKSLQAVLSGYRYGRSGQNQFAVADIYAVYLANRSGSPKVKSFIDALIEHVGTPEPYWDR